jgi:enoyl-CoA hydratase
MTTLVSYEQHDGVAAVTMDDGKANVLSFAMFEQVGEALDRAESEGAVVLLAGRPGRFSGGFDLSVLTSFSSDAARLLRTGFELSHRLLSFPRPVVVACTGHAYAMGAFLVLSGDHRLGVAGSDHRITANEVAIGMTLPRAALEVCRQRLAAAHFERAMLLAEVFSHEGAVPAGWLDEVVPEADLLAAARAKAATLTTLDLRAHAETKLRARGPMLAALQTAIEEDDVEFRAAIALVAGDAGAG